MKLYKLFDLKLIKQSAERRAQSGSKLFRYAMPFALCAMLGVVAFAATANWPFSAASEAELFNVDTTGLFGMGAGILFAMMMTLVRSNENNDAAKDCKNNSRQKNVIAARCHSVLPLFVRAAVIFEVDEYHTQKTKNYQDCVKRGQLIHGLFLPLSINEIDDNTKANEHQGQNHTACKIDPGKGLPADHSEHQHGETQASCIVKEFGDIIPGVSFHAPESIMAGAAVSR